MLQVRSEIGRLRRVLMHEPGLEVDRMVPPMMEELLFDDILFGDRAREEHRRFRRLLQLLGIEVVEALDLLAETLEDAAARGWLLDLLAPELTGELRTWAQAAGAAELAAALVEGVLRQDTCGGMEVGDLFAVTPLPNWCFQRDPQVVLGSGVVFAAMATAARWREGLLARCMFRFHASLAAAEVLLDPLAPDTDSGRLLGLHRPRLEGGDLLVLSDDLVALGVSERSNLVAAELVARALARREQGPRWLEIVHLPKRRAYMHLDTVFTQADHDAALLFPPVMATAGGEVAQTYEVDLHGDDLTPSHRGDLLAVLAGRGLELEPIACGGGDPVAQQREQWTDGANAVALAPGVIVLYDRNVATIAELDRRGFAIVDAEDVLLGRTEITLDGAGRTCLLLSSHEISRARGGPRCLTHPLVRDVLG